METRCTLFSPVRAFEEVLRIFERSLEGWSLSLEGKREEWDSARFKLGDRYVELHSLVEVEPGDQFNKVKFGTVNFFRGPLRASGPTPRSPVVDFLKGVEWIVGVVALEEPRDGGPIGKALDEALSHVKGGLFVDGKHMVFSPLLSTQKR